jgi:alpha/beta superfamily hydrolase
MAEVFHRSFFLKGPAGQLEAMLWTVPEVDSSASPDTYQLPSRAAIVCHPHPMFGGTMHNKVVYQAAKALHQRGIPVLRFNFRGVGLSEGAHDRGRGEQDDVRAGLDYLAAEFPERPILLAGFSFGAWVGLRVGCEDARVSNLICLGLPVDRTDLTYLHTCTKPKLIVQGGNDQFGSLTNLEPFFAAIPEPKKLVIIEGVDHFFTGKLPEMGAAIHAWLDERNIPEPKNI